MPGKPAPKVGALCTVNPERGLEPPEGGWPEVKEGHRVLVVGGGVAGMMAAITATDRGHQVTLVEKTDRLGGTISFIDHDPYKVDYKNYKDLLVRRVADRRIPRPVSDAGHERAAGAVAPGCDRRRGGRRAEDS